MTMELKSSTVWTIGNVERAVLTAVLVFIFLKTFECIVRKLLLISPRGRLSPEVWARSVLLSEAWDTNALLRLLLGRTRYDAAGGVKVVKHRPSARNVALLSLFILTVLLAEVALLYGSLESEKEVRADSVKLQFRHSGKVASSEAVAKKGCQWADVHGQNFQLTAPVGVCWAEGNGDSEGFVLGPRISTLQYGRSLFFVKQYKSAVYIEVNALQGTLPGSPFLVTKAYMAAIIVSSSGLSSRVKMESNTSKIIQSVIEQHARSKNCSVSRGISENSDKFYNDRIRSSIANSSSTEIICLLGIIGDFATTDKLLGLVSGGFTLEQGNSSPWEGNITSEQGSPSGNVIGVDSRSRIGLLALLLITLGTLLLRLGAHFLPGDNENIAMKIVMERIGGNYCTEDATASVGEAVSILKSANIAGEKPIGHIGTIVPIGFTQASDLNNMEVNGVEDPSACDGEQISMVASVNNTNEEPTGHVGTTVPEGYTQVANLTGLDVQSRKRV